ncbi:MAG: hypothetical protein HC915_15520 [Anaerolineae bacterium]|nr:hypothetical protein [Anaerolineae bacterium]
MNLHLVGGFLGSGKTTTITQAALLLLDAGQRVGIVTNDQGRYLVDTAFAQRLSLPTVEVTGGCFCCNYGQLEAQLHALQATAQPDVIFAESVGSCADIVATVVKPFQQLSNLPDLALTSFSVLVDARLLRRTLAGQPLPFSEDVVYIFGQQIEEAGLLVINKADLLSPAQQTELRRAAVRAYPHKTILLQSATRPADLQNWLDQLGAPWPRRSLALDYGRYGAGEAQLAWLNEALHLHSASVPLTRVARTLVLALLDRIKATGGQIGHLKLLLEAGPAHHKLSFTAEPAPDWEAQLADLPGHGARVLVNARVECPVEALEDALTLALVDTTARTGATYRREQREAFHPAFPRPTHRIGN